jgi:hypothetical protein
MTSKEVTDYIRTKTSLDYSLSRVKDAIEYSKIPENKASTVMMAIALIGGTITLTTIMKNR